MADPPNKPVWPTLFKSGAPDFSEVQDPINVRGKLPKSSADQSFHCQLKMLV